MKVVEHMLEFEEYKDKLNNLKPILSTLESALKLKDAEKELESLRLRPSGKISGATCKTARKSSSG